MGYDVHITRAAEWSESESVPISLAEWLDYVANDPEMRLDNFAEAVVSGRVLRYENVGLAVWTSYPGRAAGGRPPWFDYRSGRVVVKNPDDMILDKMREIASALDGRVVGDEGELY